MYVEYSQSSGIVRYNDGSGIVAIGIGRAGAAGYINDPAADHRRNQGPLPRGIYRMGVVSHPRFASPAIALRQTSGESHGRSGFFIHGGTKSEGCILLEKPERAAIAHLIRGGCIWLVVQK